MQPLAQLEGMAITLLAPNIDTDQILPGQFLAGLDKQGLGKHLFHNLRFHADGSPRAENPFDTHPGVEARILISGANFGCGSSREHAAWALLDFGIRCVIAPSFGDIFRSNCAKNGILALIMDVDMVAQLAALSAKGPFAIDLDEQVISLPDGDQIHFEIDDNLRRKLSLGLDDIDETLAYEPFITVYEVSHGRRLTA